MLLRVFRIEQLKFDIMVYTEQNVEYVMFLWAKHWAIQQILKLSNRFKYSNQIGACESPRKSNIFVLAWFPRTYSLF